MKNLTLSIFSLLLSLCFVANGSAQGRPDVKPGAEKEPIIEKGNEDRPVEGKTGAREDLNLIPIPDPDPELFAFVRNEPMVADPNHDRDIARMQASMLKYSEEELNRLLDEADRKAVPEDDLAKLHTLDGRIFEERPEVLKIFPPTPDESERTSVRPKEDRLDQDKKGENFWDKAFRHTATKSGIKLTGPERLILATIFGSDDRKVVKSAKFPWGAVGVMLDRQSDSGIARCSGAMISHRLVLTAAHCFTSNGKRVTNPQGVNPASRGLSFEGNRFPAGHPESRFPFGARKGIWYWWPRGWRGKDTDIRYDYGVILLADINWRPGFVLFGSRGYKALDFRTYNNVAYPFVERKCKDSPKGQGEDCDGFMYRQFGPVRSVAGGRMYNKLDIAKGMSGSPIYDFDGNDRRVVVGVISTVWEGGNKINIATRIRAPVFDMICRRLNNPNNKSSFFKDPHC